jgi:hypothetical protein
LILREDENGDVAAVVALDEDKTWCPVHSPCPWPHLSLALENGRMGYARGRRGQILIELLLGMGLFPRHEIFLEWGNLESICCRLLIGLKKLIMSDFLKRMILPEMGQYVNRWGTHDLRSQCAPL